MYPNTSIRELMQKYETALTDYGLSASTRLQHLQRAVGLVNFHAERGLTRLDEATVADYIAGVNEKFCNGCLVKDSYHTVRRMTDRFLYFAQTGALKLPNPLSGCRQTIGSEFEPIAAAFIATIPHPNTRNDARWVVHKYFAWLELSGHGDLIAVGANEIRSYLLYASKQYSQNSMRTVKLYLSKLYAWLYENGNAESTYQQLLSFPISYEVKVGLPPSRDDLAKMLDTINRVTAIGKRAYAAMMLGIVLGLRAVDVANLKLTDVDWQNGVIKILQTKTAKSVILPLTRDVGEALADYILNGRPQSDSPYVFLRMLTPHTGIGATAIGEIYRDCCKAAGLPVSKRFHNLRRALGTSMVNAGVPVTTAAQVFGDVDIDPMKQYIAVDTEHLKLCALPFNSIAPIGGDAE